MAARYFGRVLKYHQENSFQLRRIKRYSSNISEDPYRIGRFNLSTIWPLDWQGENTEENSELSPDKLKILNSISKSELIEYGSVSRVLYESFKRFPSGEGTFKPKNILCISESNVSENVVKTLVPINFISELKTISIYSPELLRVIKGKDIPESKSNFWDLIIAYRVFSPQKTIDRVDSTVDPNSIVGVDTGDTIGEWTDIPLDTLDSLGGPEIDVSKNPADITIIKTKKNDFSGKLYGPRRRGLKRMWESTKGMFISVEPGDFGGFNRTLTIRESILRLGDDKYSPKVIAPCSHSEKCPLQDVSTKIRCNTLQRVARPQRLRSHRGDRGYEDSRFSFVSIIRDNSKTPISSSEQVLNNWARIIETPQKRKGHVNLSLCDSNGELKRMVSAKSHGRKGGYRHARKSKKGDLWPYPEYIERNINE